MTLGWISSLNRSPYRTPDERDPRDDDAPRGAELVAEDGRSLPLVRASLRVDAGGGIARAVLEQEFENDSDEVLRVTYKMPLPADGAVSGYAFTIGARTVKGRVDPKKVARERFEEALASGKTAAILEQERADIFTQDIGNIPARTTIVARITVDMRLAWLPEGEWEMRFPTVIGPRYVGATATAEEARAVAIQVADRTRARLHLEVRVTDAITAGRRVESPSHQLRACGEPDELGAAFELEALEGARLDRDVAVRWAVTKPQVGISIATTRHGGETYGLVTIVPPAPEARVAALPRDLIVLIDTSGSMGGTPLESAKKIVASLVASLGAEDRLELVEFSSSPRPWRSAPALATERDKKDALRWLRGLSAGGATEMHTAVMGALRSLREGAQRQVVLVTDGYIGGEEQIVTMCHDELPAGCRLHFVGVGAAPNRSLATAMARAGRGAEILVAPGEDAERGGRRLLARTAAPVLTDVTIEGAEAASRFLPDVFAGSPVLAAVKLEGSGDLVVRGKLAHGTWQQRVRVPARAHAHAALGGEGGEGAEGSEAIAALFAREKVADLEIESLVGPGTDRGAAIEELGVAFQIATRMTSWVAIDEDPSVDPYAPSRHVEVPQELPYGTSFASFGLAGPVGMVGTLAGAGGMAPGAALARPAPMAAFGAPPPAQAQTKTGGSTRLRRAAGPLMESQSRASAPLASPAPPRSPRPAVHADAPAPEPQPLQALGAPAKRRPPRPWLAIFFLLSLVIAILALAWYFLR
jgi:Ca-activated chloride channel family protein